MLVIEGLRVAQGAFTLTADLTIPEGGVTAVMGPSGAGKSTLLAAIAGFLPVSGQILWQGQAIGLLPPWQRPVSLLFQDNNLFPHLTVAQNVGLAVAPRRRLTRAETAGVATLLARLGLADLAHRRPGALSGGQAARAALARVLAADRPLVLLDEPFAALGPALRAEMLALTRAEVAAKGGTVLMVTHAPEDARAIADRLVTVADGQATGPLPLPQALDDPAPALAAYLGR